MGSCLSTAAESAATNLADAKAATDAKAAEVKADAKAAEAKAEAKAEEAKADTKAAAAKAEAKAEETKADAKVDVKVDVKAEDVKTAVEAVKKSSESKAEPESDAKQTHSLPSDFATVWKDFFQEALSCGYWKRAGHLIIDALEEMPSQLKAKEDAFTKAIEDALAARKAEPIIYEPTHMLAPGENVDINYVTQNRMLPQWWQILYFAALCSESYEDYYDWKVIKGALDDPNYIPPQTFTEELGRDFYEGVVSDPSNEGSALYQIAQNKLAGYKKQDQQNKVVRILANAIFPECPKDIRDKLGFDLNHDDIIRGDDISGSFYDPKAKGAPMLVGDICQADYEIVTILDADDVRDIKQYHPKVFILREKSFRLYNYNDSEIIPLQDSYDTYGKVPKERQYTPGYVFVFRGTKKLKDDVLDIEVFDKTFDVEFSAADLHQGFADAAIRCYEHLKKDEKWNRECFAKYGPDHKKKMHLRFTGHSLGATTATLFAGLMKNDGWEHVQQIITFGQPKAVTAEYAFYWQVKLPLYRVVNVSDIIPEYPNNHYYQLGPMIELSEDFNLDGIDSPKEFLKKVMSTVGNPFAQAGLKEKTESSSRSFLAGFIFQKKICNIANGHGIRQQQGGYIDQLLLSWAPFFIPIMQNPNAKPEDQVKVWQAAFFMSPFDFAEDEYQAYNKLFDHLYKGQCAVCFRLVINLPEANGKGMMAQDNQIITQDWLDQSREADSKISVQVNAAAKKDLHALTGQPESASVVLYYDPYVDEQETDMDLKYKMKMIGKIMTPNKDVATKIASDLNSKLVLGQLVLPELSKEFPMFAKFDFEASKFWVCSPDMRKNAQFALGDDKAADPNVFGTMIGKEIGEGIVESVTLLAEIF